MAAECQFNLAQRPPLRPRPSSCACQPCATRQRRQLLRIVGSHRWCRRERTHRLRGDSGNRMSAGASSLMEGCSTGRATLAENGATTHFPGKLPTNTPDLTVGADGKGCLETWVSGPGVAADHARVTGETLTAEEIAARAERGNGAARATLSRHADRSEAAWLSATISHRFGD